jgi:hypothetical protein
MLRAALVAVVGLHFALLAASLPDYMVGVDSAFHVALARQYGEHGAFFWDAIHYGPAHRPNLQGPAMHVAIGLLGRLLGGSGDDYIRANALLGLGQWCAAIATVVFFARRCGATARRSSPRPRSRAARSRRARTALGSRRAGCSSRRRAIHFFVARRLALATAATALACYAHLGGFVTALLGVAVAALLTRRLRDLVVVAAGVAVVTAPY